MKDISVNANDVIEELLGKHNELLRENAILKAQIRKVNQDDGKKEDEKEDEKEDDNIQEHTN